ncbi:3-beta hydroxysteroid dehydrogenase/isomerase family protein [Talaromyces proteolyticus]|uniref:3-beta hydroxysteroid dehydrogenase/isomerase family protein n=1 Tax=Talaromyces proteolyticus TaxID=1131652 RepID=A0AAD4KII8_9EURO|nr:3-beta hydroxysteroid dehydrogenase/isomerase family protein [Talaromyces proteolyticus]KAH8690155.1 3-beta hydroxysteroid dehydrogenase/isomerase family protein [Talaromyces proteolyticus]
MTSGLIFVTGATGFIGIATALEALKAGYRLRVAIRQESQIQKVKKVLSEYADKLEFAIVPDITDDKAYTGKLDGVDYVLHIASPLARTLDKKDYFEPAPKGTVNILKEATKVSSVKKVVITSSIVAFIPLSGVPEGGVVTEEPTWDLTVDVDGDFTGPHPKATAFKLYHASKILANDATWEFKKRNDPNFSLVTIHPTFVYGHDLFQTTPDEIGGTNSILWNAFVSGEAQIWSSYVNVRDVAKAHIKALDSTIPDGSKYLVAGKDTTWKEVAQLLKKNYPSNELFKLSEATTGIPLPANTSKAEKELGIDWISLEDTIKEVVEQNSK